MELVILNQTYSEWQWLSNEKEILTLPYDLNPANLHLFHGDILDEVTEEIVVPSAIRSEKNIPCVLDYKGNTHGRCKNNNKPLYRCIPNDKSLPHFIVPFQPKTTGFDKHKINKYVLIQFKEWPAEEKHPLATLTHTLGDVDNYDAYTEYQLYCKGLVVSLVEFNKQTSFLKNKHITKNIVDGICDQYPSIENRTHINVFSIDPEGCTDVDDAISIVEHLDHTLISVYIANVPLIIDYFNLWAYFTDKCSTIYLPMHKLTMLPSILSDNICSLLQDDLRFTFVMDIYIPKDTNKVNYKVTFKNALIKVTRNYVYEEADLLLDNDYQQLLKFTQHMSTHKINDSHDVVEYFMILMNEKCALELVRQKCGILRSASIKMSLDKKETIPAEISGFINNWKYASGEYTTIDNKSPHHFIGYEVYTHITSPIRRLVDIVNMTLLQTKLGLLQFKNHASVVEFCNKWSSETKVKYINTTTKSIKKVQNSCSLLALHLKNKDDKKIKKIKGYVFDRELLCGKKNTHKFKYNVYIPEYNMVTTFKTDLVLENYIKMLFTIHVFMEETCLKQKIRLQLN